ncbi:hypothetical protein TVAG_297520 [Trichomonas vaginalis G3]|uniref:DUF3447 domain-containing protein n=1 Tax=Trichomonas vaginalis (strain ATCC PRA-98 / G3) TaxID=412133 RepID=A2DRE7_TRIV3|nr:protein of unknown function (DUF3447) [Trichomonas vaginalis G3]EAY17073.1 hypothetical protein TVAG_297520 [Trichomonas vaginalis G3]KAI5517945.1 protein of unknown function (DUF3447) [Trichomonas vaginalis G3]|eukprot:XP_001329296.1 hypothetical protein [Trichomonas vaginalis G3]
MKKNSKKYESQNLSLEVHEQNTIYRAIMDDNKQVFISFTEKEGFDPNQTLKSKLYPDSCDVFSLLELCCYHGSVNCFKYLISEFHSMITQNCLRFSFLSGNPEIMNQCLKVQSPDYKCMDFAIISHNIDFVSFLKNEYKE